MAQLKGQLTTKTKTEYLTKDNTEKPNNNQKTLEDIF